MKKQKRPKLTLVAVGAFSATLSLDAVANDHQEQGHGLLKSVQNFPGSWGKER